MTVLVQGAGEQHSRVVRACVCAVYQHGVEVGPSILPLGIVDQGRNGVGGQRSKSRRLNRCFEDSPFSSQVRSNCTPPIEYGTGLPNRAAG